MGGPCTGGFTQNQVKTGLPACLMCVYGTNNFFPCIRATNTNAQLRNERNETTSNTDMQAARNGHIKEEEAALSMEAKSDGERYDEDGERHQDNFESMSFAARRHALAHDGRRGRTLAGRRLAALAPLLLAPVRLAGRRRPGDQGRDGAALLLVLVVRLGGPKKRVSVQKGRRRGALLHVDVHLFQLQRRVLFLQLVVVVVPGDGRGVSVRSPGELRFHFLQGIVDDGAWRPEMLVGCIAGAPAVFGFHPCLGFEFPSRG